MPSSVVDPMLTPGNRRPREGEDPDYSGNIQKKLKASNRAGQACDRCKVSRLPLERPNFGPFAIHNTHCEHTLT
jgi:hypothetical protein